MHAPGPPVTILLQPNKLLIISLLLITFLQSNNLCALGGPPMSRVLSEHRNLVLLFQVNRNQLFPQVHPKNNLTRESFTALNGRSQIWWRCIEAHHEWKAKIQTRLRGEGNCPICIKTIKSQFSLAQLFPEIARDWYSRNLMSAYSISPGSKTKVWWECHICLHKWQTQVRSRTKHNTGCPNCYVPNRSENEIRISFELSYCFEPLDISDPKIVIDNKLIYVDILLPQYKLAIEYDGSTTHANTLEKDVEKNRKLIEFGYTVVRIREKPLVPTSSLDILLDKNTSIKKCVNQVLDHLQKMLNITSPYHDTYLKRKLCINTGKADTFISQQKFNKFVETSCDLAKKIELDDQISLDNIQMEKLKNSLEKFAQRKEKSGKTKIDQFLADLASMKLETIPKLVRSPSALSYDEESLLKIKNRLRPTVESQSQQAVQIALVVPTSYKPIIGFEKPAPPKPDPLEFVEESDEELISRYRRYYPSLDDAGVLAAAKQTERIKRNPKCIFDSLPKN